MGKRRRNDEDGEIQETENDKEEEGDGGKEGRTTEKRKIVTI